MNKSIWILLLVFGLLSTSLIACDKEEQQPSTCNNGVLDGNETGVDCGGSCSPCNTPSNTFYFRADFDGVSQEFGYSNWQSGILDEIVWERSPGNCAYRFGSQTSYSEYVNLIFYKDLSCSSSYPDLDDRRGYLTTGTYNFGTADGEVMLESNPGFFSYYITEGDQSGSSLNITNISAIDPDGYFTVEGTINCVLREGSSEIVISNGSFLLVIK